MKIDVQEMEHLKASVEYKKVFNPDERKMTQVKAQTAMRILIACAIQRKPITYSELAEELGVSGACRSMGIVSGNVGSLLQKMNETVLHKNVLKGRSAPPLGALLVSKKTKTPSKGFDSFLPEKERDLYKGNKKGYLDENLYNELALYDWNFLLNCLGLPELKYNVLSSPILSLDDHSFPNEKYGKGVEGEKHKALKEFIHKHPEIVGIKGKFLEAQKKMEQVLPSGDRLDVFFENETQIIAVEVKPLDTKDKDINRGVFQCKKYMAVLEANNLALYSRKPIRVLLVLGGLMPAMQKSLCQLLDVEYIDGFGDKSK